MFDKIIEVFDVIDAIVPDAICGCSLVCVNCETHPEVNRIMAYTEPTVDTTGDHYQSATTK